MKDLPEDQPEDPNEPPIIVVGLGRKNYYLFKGDEYLNQILLVDGEYPKPVLCVHFESTFEAKQVIGDAFKPGKCWGLHPEIIERLRATKTMVETDA